jgi:hypothetical protein
MFIVWQFFVKNLLNVVLVLFPDIFCKLLLLLLLVVVVVVVVVVVLVTVILLLLSRVCFNRCTLKYLRVMLVRQ